MIGPWIRSIAAWLAIAGLVLAQQPQQPLPRPPAVPPGFGPRIGPGQNEPAKPQAEPPKPPEAAKPPQQTAPQQTPQQAAPAQPATTLAFGGFSMQNASLTEVIDILARLLKINYVLDPGVRGGVYLNTYGDTSKIDARSLLDSILRINGYAMVKTGDIYRIVKMADALRLPLKPEVNAKNFPEDDQVMLNLVFLKYTAADELSKLLEPFNGPDSKMMVYAPANLLLILDSRRNLKRTMDLVALFDSEEFVSQRIRLFEVKNRMASDLSKELENIMKSISLNEKSSFIKLMPLDRINTIVGVATNPVAFDEVEKWLKKLDIAVKATAGSVDNYVYRVKYGRADAMAGAIMMLYMGSGYGMGMGGYGMGGYGMGGYGMGGYGMGGYGMGGYGMGGYGMGGYGMGGYGMGGYGGGYGGYPGGGYGYPTGGAPGFSINPGTPGYPGAAYGFGPVAGSALPTTLQAGSTGTGGAPGAAGTTGQDLTGSYLGGYGYGMSPYGRIPRVVPNPFDNTLLIQATSQEYEGILKLLRELDVPPRQVLVEAKIYEVTLTGALASGVSAFLQKQGTGKVQLDTKSVVGTLADGSLSLSAGALVGRTRELLAFLSTQEATQRAKVISAPSLIATDSIAASINVGTEVPTLAAQAPTAIQSGGSSLFAQSIQTRNSGVTLNVMARINPSGIVTLVINQEVSAPQAPSTTSAIQSPSFSKRSVQTQVTVQDGDTIAVGGIINESNTSSSSGIPFLHRIPVLGAAFGSKSISKERTELIVFMTPHVIYDTNQIVEASDELKARVKNLRKIVKE